MLAGTHLVELVLHPGVEGDLAALHFAHAYADLNGHAEQRRRKMLYRDFHADRILALVGMLDNELAAGVLDVENHGWGCIGTRLLAHETNGASAINKDAVGASDAWSQAWLHDDCSCPAL